MTARAHLAGLRQQLYGASLVMRQQRGRPQESDLYVAGNQVVDRLARSSIGNMVQFDAGLPGELSVGACAAGREFGQDIDGVRRQPEQQVRAASRTPAASLRRATLRAWPRAQRTAPAGAWQQAPESNGA